MASGEETGKIESNENQAAPPRRVIKRRGTAQQTGQKSPLSTPKGKIPSTSSSSDVGMTSDTLQELLSAADEEEASRPKGRPRRLRSNSPSIEKETETMKITVSLQLSPPQDQESVEGNDSKIEDPDESRDGDVTKTQEGDGSGDGEVAESSDVDMSKATESLRIEGFTRPLPTKALQELLQKYGTVVSFWLQGVKKFCMVTYENKEQAAAALGGIDGTSWPEENRPKLAASFISTQEVQEALAAKSQVKPNEKESRPTKALDELFRRTKAKPVIYWLPLTADEVARKDKELKQREDRKDRSKNSDRNKLREKDGKEKKSKQESGRGKRRRTDSPTQSKKQKSKSRSPSKQKKDGTKVDVVPSVSNDSVKVEPGSPKPETSQSTDNKSGTTKPRSSSPVTSKSKPTTKSKAKKKKSASSSSSPSKSKSSSPERPKSKKSR
jgi:hypothetical protein